MEIPFRGGVYANYFALYKAVCASGEAPSVSFSGFRDRIGERVKEVLSEQEIEELLFGKKLQVEVIKFSGREYISWRNLYDSASPKPLISLKTFLGRTRNLERSGDNAERIKEALYTSSEEYKRRYARPSTYVEVEGSVVDYFLYFENAFPESRSLYVRSVRRIKDLSKRDCVTRQSIVDSIQMPYKQWMTNYGSHNANPVAYQDLQAASLAELTRLLGIESQYPSIRHRVNKLGWSVAQAIEFENFIPLEGEGFVYLISHSSSDVIYIGSSRTSTEIRWAKHLADAAKGSNTDICKAIRYFGSKELSLHVIESGIALSSLISRERYWYEAFLLLGCPLRNMRPPSGMSHGPGAGICDLRTKKVFPSKSALYRELAEEYGVSESAVARRIESCLPLSAEIRTQSKHPAAGSKPWRRWLKMHRKFSKFEICKRWWNYDHYAQDTEPRPSSAHILCRIDERLPWGPTNTRWMTRKEQKESQIKACLIVDGVQYPTVTSLAQSLSLPEPSLRYRMNEKGMSAEEAVKGLLENGQRKSPKK